MDVDTVARVQILDVADCISHSTNILFLVGCLVGWLFFHGISTFVGYLIPNLFLKKWSVLFQAAQFNQTAQEPHYQIV